MTRSLHLRKNTNQSPGQVAGYTCTMSSVPNGGNLTYEFDPDPVQITWTMNANVNLLPTRGGQVAYSSGRTIGPIQIVGYLRSRWDLLELAEFIYRHMSEGVLNGKPLRFVYPERDFDFSMYIQNINEVGLNGEQGEIVGYSITGVITQDHTELKKADPSQLIPALPENINWIDVENAAKIAEQRFGMSFGGSGLTPTSQEGQDGSEDKPPEEEDYLTESPPLGAGPGGRPVPKDPGFNNGKQDPIGDWEEANNDFWGDVREDFWDMIINGET